MKFYIQLLLVGALSVSATSLQYRVRRSGVKGGVAIGHVVRPVEATDYENSALLGGARARQQSPKARPLVNRKQYSDQYNQKSTNIEDDGSYKPGPEEAEANAEPASIGGVAGQAGVDYPAFKEVPETNFDCSKQQYEPGMYADEETRCQVYHVCFNGRKESFLCGVGTVFNQAILACDYWHSVECERSREFYSKNEELGKASPEPSNDGAGAVAGVVRQNVKPKEQYVPQVQYARQKQKSQYKQVEKQYVQENIQNQQQQTQYVQSLPKKQYVQSKPVKQYIQEQPQQTQYVQPIAKKQYIQEQPQQIQYVQSQPVKQYIQEQPQQQQQQIQYVQSLPKKQYVQSQPAKQYIQEQPQQQQTQYVQSQPVKQYIQEQPQQQQTQYVQPIAKKQYIQEQPQQQQTQYVQPIAKKQYIQEQPQQQQQQTQYVQAIAKKQYVQPIAKKQYVQSQPVKQYIQEQPQPQQTQYVQEQQEEQPQQIKYVQSLPKKQYIQPQIVKQYVQEQSEYVQPQPQPQIQEEDIEVAQPQIQYVEPELKKENIQSQNRKYKQNKQYISNSNYAQEQAQIVSEPIVESRTYPKTCSQVDESGSCILQVESGSVTFTDSNDEISLSKQESSECSENDQSNECGRIFNKNKLNKQNKAGTVLTKPNSKNPARIGVIKKPVRIINKQANNKQDLFAVNQNCEQISSDGSCIDQSSIEQSVNVQSSPRISTLNGQTNKLNTNQIDNETNANYSQPQPRPRKLSKHRPATAQYGQSAPAYRSKSLGQSQQKEFDETSQQKLQSFA